MLTGRFLEIVNFVQEWLSGNVKPPVEVVGSLALQMTQRAMDVEKASRCVSPKLRLLTILLGPETTRSR